MKKILLPCLFLVLLVGFGLFSRAAWATDPVGELQKQIDELNKLRQLSEQATAPLEKELATIKSRLNGVAVQLKQAEDETVRLEKSIAEREDDIGERYQYLALRVRSFYKLSRQFSPLLALLSSDSAAGLTKQLSYRSAAAGQDKDAIVATTKDILGLEEDKKTLDQRRVQLAGLRVQYEKNMAFFDKEIKGAKAYQAELSGKIADLSAKQQSILSARSGQFTASVGDSNLADDYNASKAGFDAAAPAGSFAVFSFGAHTHRKGMSQYGARGRAESGQDFKTILKAYYGKEPAGKDTGGSIKVAGHGEMSFEDKYLLGIAEMPSSWHPEALKAQAVAARTYAYRYKTENKEICTTEACQVYSASKAENSPQAWKDAVAATKGQVIEDVVTYYASTHGGYTTTAGWDTTDGGGGANFVDKSFEKKGGSPWLYKAWYTKAYSPSSDKCGRSNPWLNSEEMADIINAALYRDDRVTPVTTSCWGGNPYSHAELREKANGPSSVSSVSVSQGNGSTSQVIFQTDKGQITLSGADFKTAFNIRAPGYLSIPQSSFAFFNIEKK